MKLARLIEMCLNGMYCKIHRGKQLYDKFPIVSEALLPLILNFSLERAIKMSRKPRWD
jgi:hypothetical protein